MLRLVPIGSEMVGRTHIDRSLIERERLRRLEPRSESLIRQLLASSLEEA